MSNLVTWEGKPIAVVGSHDVSVGNGELTLKNFEDAIAAQFDPEIRTARTTLGHTVRMDGDKVQVIDRPVVGRTANLSLNGDTLHADVGVLKNVDAMAEVGFPTLSIEGMRDVKTSSGEYSLVITAVSLLSDEWPAVESLPDLEALHGLPSGGELVTASRVVACSMPAPNRAAPAANTTTQEGDPMAEPKATKEAPETDPDDKNKATDVVTEEPKGEDAPKGDEPKAKEEPAKKPTELPELPEGYTYISEATLAKLTEGAETAQKLADDLAEKESKDFARDVVAATKELPGEEERVAVAYKKNPEFVRAFYDRVKPGAAAPVGQLSTFSRGQGVTDTPKLAPSAIRFTAAERARLGIKED